MKIRLGFPLSFTDSLGILRYGGWFWGQRGKQSGYTGWTDESFKYAVESNFEGVDIGPWGHHMEESLSLTNEGDYFEADLYTNYVKEGKHFIIPIDIKTLFPDDLTYLDNIYFPGDVSDAIRQGLAKVLFFSHEEGATSGEHIKHIQNFCRNNRLTPETTALSLVNYCDSVIPEFNQRLFSVRVWSYFGEELWFLNRSVLKYTEQEKSDTLNRYVQSNRDLEKESTFLCLNRRPDWNRSFLVGFLSSYPGIQEKSKISLGIGYSCNEDCVTGEDQLRRYEGFSKRLKYRDLVTSYYSDRSKESVLRSPDTEERILQNRVDFSEELYRSTFCTVITETYYEQSPGSPRNFFSEKTYKPIYALQPFILVSTVGSLQKLREQGYRTFGKWWDESYDLVDDPEERLNCICDLIVFLSKKSRKELHLMTLDMEDTLVHNWNLLMGGQGIKETLQWLGRLSGGRKYD